MHNTIISISVPLQHLNTHRLLALLLHTHRYVLDRRVFAYRGVVSDNTVACTLLITTFFASVSFIVLFLGLESVLEGLSAGKDVSTWVRQGANSKSA